MSEKLTLSEHRGRMKKDQNEWGSPAGLDQQQVSNRENGKVPWRLDEVAAICDAFGIDTGSLLLKP